MQLKAVLVDAVLNREVPSEYCEAWVRSGLVGYDHRAIPPAPTFSRQALESLRIDELYQLYCETRARY